MTEVPTATGDEIDFLSGGRLAATHSSSAFPQNRGKAAALNEALSEMSSEVVVCLDADTVVETKEWNAMLARFADFAQRRCRDRKYLAGATRSLIAIDANA